MKKLLFILVILISGLGPTRAQQDAIYSQYMFNPFAINPAYAGSRDAFSAVLLHRAQWLGLDGAPQTSSLAVHSPFRGTNMAAGLNLFSDRLGPTSNFGAAATYAYHLNLRKGKLSLGVRAGIYSSTLDRSQLDYYQGGDPYDQGGGVNATVPSFDFGVYYYGTKVFAGLSATHLGGSNALYNNDSQIALDLDQHYIAFGGVALPISKNVIMRPTTYLKYVVGSPFNADVNVSFLFKQIFWLGAGYRSSGSINLLAEFNITPFLRMGYSYDAIVSSLRKHNIGTHELFIGIDFNLKKDRVISPRFM